MAPPTALDKAIHERKSVTDTIDYLQIESDNHATRPLNLPSTLHFLAMAETAQKEVMAIHNKIQATSPPDMAPHNAEYQILLGKAARVVIAFTTIKMSFPGTSTGHGSGTHIPSPDIKLPRLELPSFDGTLQDWVSFRDMFVTTVHSNTTLCKSQKLTYLKSQLKGEAARQLSSMTICDANYDIAWSLLTDRYQNDRELLFAILRRFTNQATVPHNSSTAIRQLVDVSKECIRSLDVLKLPTIHWDAILLFLIVNKLDPSSKELWEQGLKDSTIPTLRSLYEFLEQRARALAASGTDTPSKVTQPPAQHSNQNSNKPGKRVTRSQSRPMVHHANSPSTCKICENQSHPLYKCEKFMGWSIQQRSDAIRKINACYNCLREGHRKQDCTSKSTCRSCGYRHHTLLHARKEANPGTKPDEAAENPPATTFFTSSCSSTAANEYDTLLATALVRVADKHGKLHTFRVLADNGSNTHFVTESCLKRIGAPRRRCFTSATGLGGSSLAHSTGITQFTVMPHFDSSISFPVSRCLITTKITGKLPSSPFDHAKWSHLCGLQLADPTYHEPRDVDMLLGAEFFFSILECGKQSGPSNSPIAIKTSFGWLIGGGSAEIPLLEPQTHSTLTLQQCGPSSTNSTQQIASDDEHLNATLQRFWELQSEPTEGCHTSEEKEIESHFRSTYRRDATGRFTVQLPFKIPRLNVGHSYNIALKRLLYLERRLKTNPEARKEYASFMREYEALGHMEEVLPVEPSDQSHTTQCYIPHQFVRKESSTTTKFRVVFDASAKTSNGISLNDTLMVGPTIQDSLVDILCRFRLHKIAFTADIAKMYRQIKVTSSDADLQRIVWREDATGPVKHYRLLTLTYGTAPASFLSTRVLDEHAKLEADSFPRASLVARRDFFVDDLMSGEPSLKEALNTQQQLLELMKAGSLQLRKWSSNSQAVLDSLPPDMRETQSLLTFDLDPTIKTLGICWNPKTDKFLFKLAPLPAPTKPLTKRNVLSELARLFDPVGWLAPIIITAKIVMQSLWKLDQGWDDALPQDSQRHWMEFRTDLENLSKLEINRFYMWGTSLTAPSLNVTHPSSPVKFCLAGFCDASQKAYAAAVYLCAYDGNSGSVSLVASKTRVAPVKEISLPRLELCGADILAELLISVKTALRIPIHSLTAWTDSTVTLAWIQAPPSRWKTFVANRVTKIQERIPSSRWGHVRGDENPADCASRGIKCDELTHHPLWWTGPTWLKTGTPTPRNCNAFDSTTVSMINVEAKKVVTFHTISTTNQLILDRYSSLNKLIRVTAMVFRFIKNCRPSQATNPQNTKIIVKLPSCGPFQLPQPLTTTELTIAEHYWIRLIQQQAFAHELNSLQRDKPLSHKSKLLSLSPFVDQTGILRVGGRLKNSNVQMTQRHPILLPTHNRFTQMLIKQEHQTNLHAGPQLLMSTLQRHYWIPRAKDAIRRQIKTCVVCTRHKAQTMQQIMADLPSFRVNQARPFSKSGVDYAGPFHLRPIQPRSKTTIKAYLAVFVCCTTRAIHLEVVSSLSTDAFMAAFRRFTSRRGRPSDLYSDCGTNFIGADHEMKDFQRLILSQQHNTEVANQLSNQGIQWHFNPPASPHFGGLWESGVKSVKYHLRRVVGLQRLTFEEMTTVTSQVEAILNSRPLTPESSDPDDLNALTPGHFLTGGPLNAIPEPSVDHLNTNRLSRWQLLQQMTQSFWKRWSDEYLTRLQQRPKWMTGNRAIVVGDMVLIKDENLPPLRWKLGRVQTLHPGADSVVRVFTLKTSSGDLKRPVVKLCLLPIEVSSNSSNSQESS